MAISAALAALALATPARAQKTLRIADYLPPTHYLVEVGLKPFMEEITKATDGAITFQHFPSQQLGKATDIVRLTQTNVAQIGVSGVSFAADKMEMSDVAQLPGLFAKSCTGVHAYMDASAAGAIQKLDYERNGVHLLYPMAIPPFQLFTRTKPVATLADINGLKIGTPMRAPELLLEKYGAAPVNVSSGPAGYEAITRGTVDGLIWAADSVFSYDMQGILKFGTQNANFGSQMVVVVINDAAWKALDPATQAIFAKASAAAAQRVCDYVDEGARKALEKLGSLGSQLTVLPPSALADLQAKSSDVLGDWAKRMDDRGRPGTEVLTSFRAAVAKQP